MVRRGTPTPFLCIQDAGDEVMVRDKLAATMHELGPYDPDGRFDNYGYEFDDDGRYSNFWSLKPRLGGEPPAGSTLHDYAITVLTLCRASLHASKQDTP